MKLNIGSDMQEIIDGKVRSGEYATPEEVIFAGLAALKQQEAFGEFGSGELTDLIDEGERSLSEFGAIDADGALAARRARRTNGEKLTR
ncbi:MAG: type II toxin-antitoxin system ParD family antitoxin [Phycisphaerales bacterium]|nr:type II toxin-antitoxin system ParD family antitoxin [Phycisphaerales bacterium]